MRLAAAFLLGIACSLWLLPVLVGPRIQELRLERDEALARVKGLEEEAARLKASLKTKQTGPVVKHVDVQLTGADRRVLLEAERRIQKELSATYVGRGVEEVVPFVLARRVQGDIYTIDGVRYQLQVSLIAVGSTVAIYGELELLK